MNFKYLISFLAVIVLFLISYISVESAAFFKTLFGIWIPYIAFAVFVGGLIYKMWTWVNLPVPFNITSTCGQQKSFPWIEQAKIDNPSSKLGVVVRMALEVLFFRSLFRNTKAEMKEGNRISYELEKWLWLFALAFHYSFLVVVIRHLRLFTEPTPYFVNMIELVDSFFRVEIARDVVMFGLPGIFLSGFVLLGAVTFLFLRRVVIPQVRYISLAQDYFPLFLIFAIAFTGILMRYFLKVDIVSVKELTMGLVTFHPSIPQGIGSIFFVHLFFVSVLLIYFPFSKLMHAGGVFLSPTRNLRGNVREFHHENPWNYPVKFHTYEAYEDDFREKMIEAGLPVEKE